MGGKANGSIRKPSLLNTSSRGFNPTIHGLALERLHVLLEQGGQ